MATYEFMDISTGHLADGDVVLLDGGKLPLDVMAYNHGWIVSTAKLIPDPLHNGDVHDLRGSGLSPEFIAAAELAGQRNCWLLRFDVDADLDPDLPAGGYGLDASEIDAVVPHLLKRDVTLMNAESLQDVSKRNVIREVQMVAPQPLDPAHPTAVIAQHEQLVETDAAIIVRV